MWLTTKLPNPTINTEWSIPVGPVTNNTNQSKRDVSHKREGTSKIRETLGARRQNTPRTIVRTAATHDPAMVVPKGSRHTNSHRDGLAFDGGHELSFVALRHVSTPREGGHVVASLQRVARAVVRRVSVVRLRVDPVVADHIANGVAWIASSAVLAAAVDELFFTE